MLPYVLREGNLITGQNPAFIPSLRRRPFLNGWAFRRIRDRVATSRGGLTPSRVVKAKRSFPDNPEGGQIMPGNRAVTFLGAERMVVQDKGYPKLEDPKGRKIEHAVILKLIATNICGSDLHIYDGRFAAPSGMQMGHENTGEVVEVGSHVQHVKKGDLCSVPFNVACGTCRNCRERHTDVCLRANEELGYCGAYEYNLGGWQGGQAEYMLVPWADFQLLRFPDKAQAMEKMRDLTLLSDILPTGFHSCIEAGVRPGSTVYIAGAGPVGRCAAASAHLLGASCIIVADSNKSRLDLVEGAGYESADTSSETPVPDQVEKTSASASAGSIRLRLRRHGCHGYGPKGTNNEEEALINMMMEVVKPAGGMGIVGVYTNLDPERGPN